MASVTEPQTVSTVNPEVDDQLDSKSNQQPLVTEPSTTSSAAKESNKQDLIFDDENTLTRKMVILGTVLLPLVGMAAAIAMAWQFGWFSWFYLVMLIGGWYLTGLGVTVGYHRMLTHKSFETVKPIRFFWAAMGALSVEGSPIDWCMVHRKHHRFSDHHGDPHSPHLHEGGFWETMKGFWHAHTGWLFNATWSKSERAKYVPDLKDEPMLVWIDNHYNWWVVGTLIIPAVIGAGFGLIQELSWASLGMGTFLGFVWGGLARVCLSHHMTWSINSICHIFGSQDYKSADDSRNNLFFGIFSHGEGWHNNHHAFPSSARHGLKWWQFDLSWVIIRTLEICGLAWNVKLPSKSQLERKAVKK
ncbi:MAG: acyl-CoA desaturase [Planctomycetota bacterium]